METQKPPLCMSDFFLLSRLKKRIHINRDTFSLLFLLAGLPSCVITSGFLCGLGITFFSGLGSLFVCLVNGEREVCVYELDLGRCMTPCVAPFRHLPYPEEIAGHQKVLTLLTV